MGICICGFDSGETLAEQEMRTGIKHSHANLPGRCDKRCPAFGVEPGPFRYHSPEVCNARRDMKRTTLLRVAEELKEMADSRRCGARCGKPGVDGRICYGCEKAETLEWVADRLRREAGGG